MATIFAQRLGRKDPKRDLLRQGYTSYRGINFNVDLNFKLEDAQSTISELSSKLFEKEVDLREPSKIETELGESVASILSLEKSLFDATGKLRFLEADKNLKEVSLEALQFQVSTLEEDLEVVRAKNEQLEA